MGKVLDFARRMTDGLENVLTGMGLGQDKSVSDSFALRPMQKAELEYAYRGDWLARKIVDTIPGDMTREWRDWQAEGPEIETLEAAEKKLKVKARVGRALVLARLYGGSAIIMGVEQGDPKEPLDVKRIGKGALKYLHTVHRHHLTVRDLDRDPMSPYFLQPKLYSLSAQSGALDIHPSRVIRFIGADLPDPDIATDEAGWGDSILQVVYDAVHNAALSQAGVSSLIHEAKIDVIGVPNLMEQLASSEYEQRLIKRMTLANVGKSVHNALIRDAAEEWSQKQISFQNLPDLMRMFLQIASGAADIPVTRLLGTSPAGLNSTGDGDLENYYNAVGARQESELRPALDTLDEILTRSALGAVPRDLWYGFPELWQISEKDKAEIGFKRAQATQIYVNSGCIPDSAMSKAVQNQLIESGDYPGLEQALADAKAEDDIPPIEEEPDPQIAPPALNDPAQPQQKPVTPQTAQDAEPRTLYVSRKVVNAGDIIRWAKGQGFKTMQPAEAMHVTIAFSRTPVDWMKVGSAWSENEKGELTVRPGGARLVEKLGDKGAVVLMFSASELSWRHESIKRDAGASWDWDEYQPHVTITYQPGELDLTKVKPYRGVIVLGPEIFEEVKDDWEKGISEV